MANRVFDFRSDLLAPPTQAIKAAVAAALDLPPEFELRGGPYQSELERRTADLLGKEDALLFPTCTMANQTALILHCQPGDAVLAEQGAHMITSEAGAPGSLAGAIVHGISGANGLPDFETVAAYVNAPASPIAPRVSALLLENTHLRSGGRVLDPAGSKTLCTLVKDAGIAVHLDGARLFNAAVAAGKPLSELAAIADTVSLSLNKGLGAPFGAMLAGSKALMDEALRVRHRLGGGFRPTAMVAAAALAALQSFNHIGEDHRRAQELAAGLNAIAGLSVAPVETNILFVTVEGDVSAVLSALDNEGVKALPYGPQRLRFVTHRGITDDAIARTISAFGRVLI